MENEVLSANMEDYLEAIFNISQVKQAAKAKDIAQKLNVRASSVTSALRFLAAQGLINYAPYDLITLTEQGHRVAKDIIGRHDALKRFFISVLGVDEAEADQAACKMEHSIPTIIVDRLIRYADYVQRCPKGGITWDSGFGYYCRTGCDMVDCAKLKER